MILSHFFNIDLLEFSCPYTADYRDAKDCCVSQPESLAWDEVNAVPDLPRMR
jgi:hypothetical protein